MLQIREVVVAIQVPREDDPASMNLRCTFCDYPKSLRRLFLLLRGVFALMPLLPLLRLP